MQTKTIKMKATNLIELLKTIVSEHGDCDVCIDYDDGCRVSAKSVWYSKEVPVSEHSENGDVLTGIIAISDI